MNQKSSVTKTSNLSQRCRRQTVSVFQQRMNVVIDGEVSALVGLTGIKLANIIDDVG